MAATRSAAFTFTATSAMLSAGTLSLVLLRTVAVVTTWPALPALAGMVTAIVVRGSVVFGNCEATVARVSTPVLVS